MVAYIARRIIVLIPVLIGVSILVFSIMKFIPGDPARMMAGMDASESDVEGVRQRLGLDQPLHIQYLTFVGNAVQGDFGRSTRSKRPVIDELRHRLPATFELAIAAMVIAVTLGLTIGVIAATRPYSLLDNAVMVIAISGVSMPVFWLGLMLVLLFSVQLGWLPTSGRGDWTNLVLPAITLSGTSMAIIARQARSGMLEVLSRDYIRTARAKGLTEGAMITRHAMRNALIPTVTIIGLQFGYLLGGAVVTEVVFAWPGVGRLLVESIGYRDYPVVQATILVLAVIFVFVNLAVDLLYFVLDPRIKVN